MKKKYLWHVFLFFSLSMLLVFSGCREKKAEEAAPVVRPVKTVAVGDQHTGRLSFPGTVQGAQRVVLAFRVSGPLIEFPVNEGQAVNKGQLLARMDPRDYRIALEEAKARFDKAQSDFRRYQSLYEREAVPLSDLEYYRAMRDVAKAKLDKAQADMEDTRLKAPFYGRIGETYVENFEEVRANQDILSLNDVRRIQIVMDLPEYLLTNVGVGERVKMAARFEALPEKEFPATLFEAAAQADPRTRTYRVTVMMDQPEEISVLPGMTAEIRLYGELQRTAEDLMFVVPADAVFAGDEGDQYVWKVDTSDMSAHRTKVAVGDITGEGYITILEGLSQGDQIVVAGVSQLREGMKVRYLDE